MKIEILCSGDRGSSTTAVHLSDLQGENGRIGVGGSEYALLTMCEAWTKRGDEVVLYNSPKKNDGIFEQRHVNAFNKSDKRDVLIVFREPNSKVLHSNGKKVFWSCDQWTIGDFAHFKTFVDQVVTISPFHTEYLKTRYGIESTCIDLPVRSWEYQDSEKIKDRIVFTSVPDRGLNATLDIFAVIKRENPNASLVITSDYRLWGAASPLNQTFIQKAMGMDGVIFLGGVKRQRLVEEQQKAQIHLYPFTGETEELFCVSVAESQVAGVLPITSADGALQTTNMGVLIGGNAREKRNYELFVGKTLEYLSNPNLAIIQSELKQKALNRFGINNILEQWDEKVYG